MRVLLKAKIPVENGNKAISDGSLPKTIQSILADQKPEAAYFVTENGERTAYVFLEMKNTSDLASLAEPWFLAFNAAVDIVPAMTAQDLGAAAPGIEAAVRKYGSAARGAGAD